MSGTMIDFAKWFMIPVNASMKEDDFTRDEILNDLYSNIVAWGMKRIQPTSKFPLVVIRTIKGTAIIEKKTISGSPIVEVDYIAHGPKLERIQFWMNESSVRDIGDKLRKSAKKRASFDSIFTMVS